MRAIIPLTLALLSAGAAARALTHCNHYCKSISRIQQISLRPECNCSLMSWDVNRDSPQLAPRHDYESIKAIPAINYAQSFPTTFTKYKYYADKMSQPKHRRRVSNERHSDNKENVFIIDIDAEGLPIYLDIDIHKSTSQIRVSDSVLNSGLNDLQLTENIVSECLNLHNVDHIRKHSATDLENKFNSKIIDRYKNISEFDLQDKIKENCVIPANIIQEAQNEIKEKTFVKRNHSVKDIVTERHEKQLGVKTDIMYQKSGEPVTIADVEETEILDRSTENIENTYFSLVSRTQFTDMTENSHVNNMESTRSTILDKTSDQSTNEDQTLFLVSTLAALTSDETTTSKYDATDLTDYIVKYDGQDYETKKVRTKFLVSKNNELTTAETPSIVLPGDTKHHELLNYSNNSKQVEFSTTSAYTSQFVKSNISLEANVTDNSYLNIDYADMDTSLSNNTAVSRSMYNEGDYPIQSIVTKEFSNDTLISNIGIESMYSRDFGNDSILVDNSSKNVSSLANTETRCVSVNCSTNKKSDSEVENIKDIQSVATDSAKEISGKLFFQYDHQHIPARFVQHADGKINVALDGDLICKHNANSTFMTALCNRMQSHNCNISQ